ncbi:MAG: polysaccharide biosynthesis C-terminal domain-containing protein [Deltaproteobacteria bacterium]|nr:polysaccharide biosynthesis C-terminal domain-containing protein [Deltaproteobacteria bacterium]
MDADDHASADAARRAEAGRKLRTGMAWNLAPVVVLGVVGLGLNFAIGRWWGTAALGVFNQVTTAYFVLASLGSIGLNLSALRAIAQEPTDQARVAAIVVGALLPATVLAAIVTVTMIFGRHAIGGWLDSEVVAEGILYAAPGLACFVVNKLLISVVNGLGRMRAFAVYSTLRYAMIGVSLGIAGALRLDATQLPIIWTITEGTLLLVLIVEVLLTVKFSRAAGWQPWLVEHLRFGIRGAGATLLFELNSRLDIWILGAAMSDSQVGIYSMAASLAEGVSQLATALQVNVNPTIAADLAANRTADVEALARRSRRWFVPGMVAVCGLAAAMFPFVIPWITGDAAFSAGALPFAMLMLGLALSSPWMPFNQVLLMGGKPGWHTIYILLSVAANVVLNLLMVPHYGLMGAAIATAIALVFSALLLRRVARSLVGVRL